MSLTAAEVAEIIRLLDASSFGELRLEMADFKLVVRRSGSAPAVAEPAAPAPIPVAAVPAAPVPAPAPPPPDDPSLAAVTAPLLGVFYRAPKPGEPPFVEPGSRVEKDTVIGIIEVMKLMNPVRAGIAGEVAAVVAENGTLVEFGQTLIQVRKAG